MTDCSSQAPACTCSAGALHITCNFAGHNCFTNHADTAELLWLMLHSSPPENSTAILPQAHSCQRVCTSVCMLPHIPLYVWLEPTVLACRNACLVMSDRMQATFLLPGRSGKTCMHATHGCPCTCSPAVPTLSF